MDRSRRAPIERLLRGISTDHVETVRDAWRELLNSKEASIPAVRSKLASPAWKDNPRGPLAKYLAVLLSVLSELDHEAFKDEIDRLRKTKLHPQNMRIVELLSRRVAERPLISIGLEIPVFVSREIADPSIVVKNLQKWAKTPTLDLSDVTRVDVIAAHPELDYLGLYNLYFSGIILTWPPKRMWGFRLWFNRLSADFTFYHEVGHHACGHTEGGQVADQEKEANDYAFRAMRKSRPVLTASARMVLLPLMRAIARLLLGKRGSARGST